MTFTAERLACPAKASPMPSGSPVKESSSPDKVQRQRGSAYLFLLLTIATISTLAGYSLQAGSTMQRQQAEEELLRVGQEIERALISYARTSPAQGGLARGGPRELIDLLKDPRNPGVQRHLRKSYQDPMTGSQTWGILRDASGAILGVYSLAQGKPTKETGFPVQWASFEESTSYADWIFGLPDARVLSNGRPQKTPVAPIEPTVPPPQ